MYGSSVYACGPGASSPFRKKDFLWDPEPSLPGFPPVPGEVPRPTPGPCPALWSGSQIRAYVPSLQQGQETPFPPVRVPGPLVPPPK